MEDSIYNKGFVKLNRSLLDWEWYDHNVVPRVFVHLLLKVNYSQGNWQGHSISEGEHITSIKRLSSDLNLSEFKIRDALKKLVETNYLKIESTNKFTKVILVESIVYSKNYIEKLEQNSIQTTNNSKTTQNQTTTNKKEKEKIEMEEKKEIFKNEVFKFSKVFSKEHLDGFYNYWSLEIRQTGRLKFEHEKFWDLEQKLTNWKVFQSPNLNKKLIKNRP